MSGEPKILLATLWHRTSERGNEYLSGFLGKARLVAFRGEPTAEGVSTWNLFISPGKDQAAAPAAASRAPRRRAPYPRSAAQSELAGDPRPFDDDISDLGR
jgi:hypothetical protein